MHKLDGIPLNSREFKFISGNIIRDGHFHWNNRKCKPVKVMKMDGKAYFWVNYI